MIKMGISDIELYNKSISWIPDCNQDNVALHHGAVEGADSQVQAKLVENVQGSQIDGLLQVGHEPWIVVEPIHIVHHQLLDALLHQVLHNRNASVAAHPSAYQT